jgi:hypothetical protein
VTEILIAKRSLQIVGMNEAERLLPVECDSRCRST